MLNSNKVNQKILKEINQNRKQLIFTKLPGLQIQI